MSSGAWLVAAGLFVLVTAIGRRVSAKTKPVTRPASAPSPTSQRPPAVSPLAPQGRGGGGGGKALSNAASSSASRWLPQGEAVTIAGRLIPGGMIYVGSAKSGVGNHSLIDPDLPVGSKASNAITSPLGYWPQYQYTSTENRRLYLQWLADGRCDPTIDIGYVFLFFYGLERRLVLDRSERDRAALVAEVQRLRGVYGTNHSFASYSSRLLEAADLLSGAQAADEPPPVRIDGLRVMSFGLRLALGKRILDGVPLTADWLLPWVLADDKTWLPTSARRLFDETCRLFRIRFAQDYPVGIKVARPKSKIGTLTYRAASSDFVSEIDGAFADWPDIGRLSKPVEAGREILMLCVAELDAASRFLGKNPEARDSLRLRLLLPRALIDTGASLDIDELLCWLGERDGLPTLLDEVLGRFELTSDDGKVGKATVRTATEILEKLGFGVEPEVRLGGRTPKPGEVVVPFHLAVGEAADSDFGAAYHSAILLLALSALIIHADEVVTPEEERKFHALVAGYSHLSPRERERLAAHARWLLAVPPSFQQVQKRLAALPEAKKAEVGRFAIAMATGDGTLVIEEIRLLERVYKALGLEGSQLFSDIHALEADTDAPVVVRPASGGSTDYKIPAPPPKPQSAGTVVLDIGRVERIRADTARVSALLSEVFVEDEPLAVVDDSPLFDDEPEAFEGLNHSHRSLLQELLTQPHWERNAFATLCCGFDLLPDGALETLNEWGFDRYGDALLDEDDPMTVNAALLAPSSGPTP